MTVNSYWQLDVAAEPNRSERAVRPHSDSVARDVRTARIARYDYYGQVARAATLTAFDGLFLPYREESDDSQIVAAVIAREVPRLGLIPEFPASVGSAVYAAKQAMSFQRLAHERLGWAIAPDADRETRACRGDFVVEEDLAARTEEFLHVARGVHGERPFSFRGQHFEVEDGGFDVPLNRVSFPKVFLQGDTEEELALSARSADGHLFRAAPIDVLRGLIETLDRLALSEGRSVEFGVIQPIVTRETAEEAAHAVLDADPDTIVGDYDGVAARLADIASLGISHVVLAASPSLEEAYRIGQHVLPRFRALTRTALAA